MNAADVFTTLDLLLQPDPARTVIRPFDFGYPDAFAKDRPTRVAQVTARLMALDETMRTRMLDLLHGAMRERHRNVDEAFLRRFEQMRDRLDCGPITQERDRLLLGAYFSQEYAFESPCTLR